MPLQLVVEHGFDGKPPLLVVDDSPKRAQAYAQMLDPLGQVVVASSSGQAAALMDGVRPPIAVVCHLDLHSVQALAALRLWSRRPELVDRLVLVAPDWEDLPPETRQLRGTADLLTGPGLGPRLLVAVQARLSAAGRGSRPAG